MFLILQIFRRPCHRGEVVPPKWKPPGGDRGAFSVELLINKSFDIVSPEYQYRYTSKYL